MPFGVVVKKFGFVDEDVAAKSLKLVVQQDEQLVVFDARNARSLDDDAVDIGVVDRTAKGPASAVDAIHRIEVWAALEGIEQRRQV